MGKHLPPLLAVVALAAIPGVAAQAQARPLVPFAGAAVIYPIPQGSIDTPTAAAHAGASAAAAYLDTLSPAALAKAGGAKLAATASGPGTFTFVLSARVHGKTVVIGKGSRTAGAAGAITVKVTLSKAGKAALAGAKGKLKVTVMATFKPKHGRAQTARSSATL